MKRGLGLVNVNWTVLIVGRGALLDPLLHVGGPRQLGRVVHQHLDGEDDVLGGEWLTVTPFHALAKVDRYRLKSGLNL